MTTPQKQRAKATSPLTNKGRYKHTETGRLANAGQWPSGTWSIVWEDNGPRNFFTAKDFDNTFTEVDQ